MKVEPILVANLLRLARAFAEHRGCTLARVGRMIHGDSYIFQRLSDGTGSITLRKYDETMGVFAEQWPADLKRPKIREPFKN